MDAGPTVRCSVAPKPVVSDPLRNLGARIIGRRCPMEVTGKPHGLSLSRTRWGRSVRTIRSVDGHLVKDRTESVRRSTDRTDAPGALGRVGAPRPTS